MISVIVPVYNEATTILEILRRVASVSIPKQVIVIDDGSTDGTTEILRSLRSPNDFLSGNDPPLRCNLTVLFHDRNRGKGAAIRTGLPNVTGKIVIIQDADLEYDPNDYPSLIQPIIEGRADVVYGSRLLMGRSPTAGIIFYLGGRFLTWLANVLYGIHITDEPTCYKVFRTEVIRSLDLHSEGFEFCPEVTALLALHGISIVEVPIKYNPRLVADGKKIGWRDALLAVKTLVGLRLTYFCHRPTQTNNASESEREARITK